ncbi:MULTISPECIES: carbohydrate ABC transporter permease [Streptomyces]|uniref:Carbohydrate ABC transporter permease n=1 Tax=Streptomyces glycanivorans TaxID=3033808 RepID=A0ABY9JER6_9ACTN|nr:MULTISPECIES: carbohydrate ABC transporter permease [unclassified Streptomyces]WSQ79691.1 carbohydrate ABC transporter permease [Streptomyces sp. NBC_01213]WLQ66245.1 carbohydrate ABC transporter permease [Streptomyces sp. Alt3]WSQ87071.1 carbohydrate ABC transporter permease [Streptomyces sp. NBC_01212]WSR06913.1 carbohydrate ABC transporter permease [Streptomyces sp. NBC_01208]WSR50348.1 carbohydrate ABC transporter permease [Streptomyces sp. NBC_01201]
MAAETPVRTLIAPAEMNRRTGRFLYRFVLVATLTGFTVAFVFPLYWMTTGAVKSSSELADQNLSLFPRSWHPESYADAWTNVGLGQFFLNTLLLAFGAWLTQLLIDVSAAYALSKLRPVLGNVVLGMMLATLMLPVSALLVPTYLTVVDVPLFHVNLINTPFAIWLPAAANAFNIFILKRFFDQIPVELLDSARIDGAGTLRVLISVVLPLSRPVLAVVSIFAVVGVWKDFLWPMLVLPDEAKQPITVALNRLSEFMPANQLLAGMVMASIPLLVLFLIFQRHIIAGLTAGSLKG